MRIQFDLRPAGMLEKERKQRSFNLTRIVAILLMLAFFAASGFYIVTMTLQRLILQDEVDTRENMISNLETEKLMLERQMGELRARERIFAETLRIMNDDLPTLEVLNALESNIDEYGIGLNTLRFMAAGGANVVEVTGLVASDKQIIEFSDRLRASGVFNDVTLPVTTLNESTGMISFTLRMPVKPIGEITRH